MKQNRVAIIGAGPAGLYAFYYAQLKGFDTYLFEANEMVGGQPSILFPVKSIHDYPGFKDIKALELINMFYNQIQDKTNIFTNTTIETIVQNEENYELVSTNGKHFFAEYVIIATGGGFFNFNKISGLESKNIHYCIKDLKLFKDKKVIIAGGGDSAIDWAIEILKNNITKDLTIVHRRDAFRANGSKIVSLGQYKQCNILLNKASKVIDENTLLITDNLTNEQQKLNFDYLIVLYGQTYSLLDNKLLKPFNLDKLNRIVVDANGKTNLKNIYAIGNASEFENKPRLISIAVVDAIKAIECIIKEIKNYE